MSKPKYPSLDTLALHAGQSPDPATGSRAVPIYATAAYVFDDSDHAAALFNMERAGHVSSRGSEVSEVVNGVLYVAGTSDDRQGGYRAVRWVD